MKNVIVVLMCILMASVVFADSTVTEPAKDKKVEPSSICPVSKISDNNRCMDCHILAMKDKKPTFTVKEISPHASYRYPNENFKFVEGAKGKEAFFLCKEIDATDFEKVFEYLSRYPDVKHLTMELHTPGGSIYQMWRIVSLMDEWKKSGRTIKAVVRGFCASAGFILLNNASEGMRYVAPTAEIMWHEVQSLELVFGFKVSTPSDKEDEARILRHFQDNGNSFLASKGKMTKEQIDEKIRKKEWWMTGKEAITFGFADQLVK